MTIREFKSPLTIPGRLRNRTRRQSFSLSLEMLFQNGEISSSVKVEDQYLRFPAVRKSDTGIYLCNGVNSVGAANAEVDLRVNGWFAKDE